MRMGLIHMIFIIILRKFEALAVNIIDEGYKVDPDKTRSIVHHKG